MRIFRQLIDEETKTYTYLIGDGWSREAVLIDPVYERLDRDLTLLEELGLKLVYTLDTHLHADHVTSSGPLRNRTGCRVVLPKACGVADADVQVEDGDAIRFGLQALEVRATPGHTRGCVTYVTANREMAFSGDTLLIRGCGRTDFQSGDAQMLFRSVRDKIFSLPDDTLLYPAHDYKGRTASSVREEKLYNPRLGGGKTEEQFVAIMRDLKLAYPKKIDVALPANERLGCIEDDVPPSAPESLPSFPIHRSGTGAPSLPPTWVSDHRSAVRLVDVREEDEWNGPDGRIEGADFVPLSQVAEAAGGWDRDQRTVVYCRSGGRSDRAATDLEALGFRRVASMTGGILKWAALGFPVVGSLQG